LVFWLGRFLLVFFFFYSFPMATSCTAPLEFFSRKVRLEFFVFPFFVSRALCCGHINLGSGSFLFSRCTPPAPPSSGSPGSFLPFYPPFFFFFTKLLPSCCLILCFPCQPFGFPLPHRLPRFPHGRLLDVSLLFFVPHTRPFFVVTFPFVFFLPTFTFPSVSPMKAK